jgi:hypothetical protein
MMMGNHKILNSIFKVGIGSAMLMTVFSGVIISLLVNLNYDIKGKSN